MDVLIDTHCSAEAFWVGVRDGEGRRSVFAAIVLRDSDQRFCNPIGKRQFF